MTELSATTEVDIYETYIVTFIEICKYWNTRYKYTCAIRCTFSDIIIINFFSPIPLRLFAFSYNILVLKVYQY
jgi:hypothetical protein